MNYEVKEDQDSCLLKTWNPPALRRFEAGLAEAAPFTPGAADTGSLS